MKMCFAFNKQGAEGTGQPTTDAVTWPIYNCSPLGALEGPYNNSTLLRQRTSVWHAAQQVLGVGRSVGQSVGEIKGMGGANKQQPQPLTTIHAVNYVALRGNIRHIVDTTKYVLY